MAKAFGKQGKLSLQPNSEITEQQDYSLMGRAVFEGDASLFSARPRKGAAHPKNKNLSCYSAKTTWLALDKIHVEAEYVGIDVSPTPYFLEFCGSVGEQAIVTHPNFVSVLGGTADNPLHNAYFDSDTKEFVGFPADAPADLGGVQTYYVPSVIVRVNYWQNEKPNPGPLGHVVNPDSIPGLILPPNCLNLLVINFSYRQLTPKLAPYQVTIEMLASEINGWNELIYPYA